MDMPAQAQALSAEDRDTPVDEDRHTAVVQRGGGWVVASVQDMVIARSNSPAADAVSVLIRWMRMGDGPTQLRSDTRPTHRRAFSPETTAKYKNPGWKD
jgi:hypothetical protein